ncbi:hypothetical protein G9A89_021341 [Geosiphon pyriformis]|nr:hypothetical protein G9A89_021341 [Geosiphon pyriformis]
MSLLLQYQKQILSELLLEDGLLLLSRGLRLHEITCFFIKMFCKPECLVLLLNLSPKEEQSVKERLAELGITDPGLRVITNNTPPDERRPIYLAGGILSITSRILIVDLLTKNIPTNLITGILVFHAERVTETSTEAFILRIYRQENELGFIKAFSDSPESFSMGLSPLQTALRFLNLRKVFLWPRFHVTIQQDLEEQPAEVIEVQQTLSEAMIGIQGGIIECMDACLSEIRRSNRWIDIDEFTVEDAMAKSFDQIVRMQLDPFWHRVSQKTKQLVGDLTALRKLLSYLVSYDCVTFNSFLETILAGNITTSPFSQKQTSPWLFMDSANTVFALAKQRVYVRIPVEEELHDQQSKKFDLPPGISPVLEEQPKWKLLVDIMNEIEHEIELSAQSKSLDHDDSTILIMTENERTCVQLREYLSTRLDSLEKTQGRGWPMLKRLLKNYFKWKSGIAMVSRSLQQTIPTKSTLENGNKSEFAINKAKTASYQRGQQPPNKRRRVRGGSVAAAIGSTRPTLTTTITPLAIEEEVKEIAKYIDSGFSAAQIEQDENSAQSTTSTAISQESYDDCDESDTGLSSQFFGLIPKSSLVVIRPYSGEADDRMLHELKPRFIIIYCPDPAFVRRIEVYKATNPGMAVRVYFMIYENSVEEQRYLTSIRKEKEAFERLIREKSARIFYSENGLFLNNKGMALSIGSMGVTFAVPAERTINTRIAGGRLIEGTLSKSKIIIDVREFRSALPSIIHAYGVEIFPCTLQVGDYILTPSMCVERKSISDLIGSMISGRLYAQCEAMSIHYKQPILLIEFDHNKAFTLMAVSDIRSDIGANDLSSKLVLLTLAFPRLKIIWSSSPYETVKIFKDLKQSHDEPDTDKAMAIGLEEGEQIESAYNLSPQDFLRALPGITSKNYKRVMSQVENIKELSEMPPKDLQTLIGQENGKELYEFFRKDVRAI